MGGERCQPGPPALPLPDSGAAGQLSSRPLLWDPSPCPSHHPGHGPSSRHPHPTTKGLVPREMLRSHPEPPGLTSVVEQPGRPPPEAGQWLEGQSARPWPSSYSAPRAGKRPCPALSAPPSSPLFFPEDPTALVTRQRPLAACQARCSLLGLKNPNCTRAAQSRLEVQAVAPPWPLEWSRDTLLASQE